MLTDNEVAVIERFADPTVKKRNKNSRARVDANGPCKHVLQRARQA
jgi:hypothetical protein